MRKLWTIARSTFAEIVRQPFYFIIIATAGALIAASPTFSAFTLMSSNKLLRDMGLSMIILAGWFLSAMAASRVVWTEIHNRTVLTMLSKPVSRGQFILGKFLGLAGALMLGCYILGGILLITARLGVKEAAYLQLDWPPFTCLLIAFGLTIFGGIGFNFFFNKPFPSSAVKILGTLLGVILLVFGFLDKELHSTFYMTSNWREFFGATDMFGWLKSMDRQLAMAIVIGSMGSLVLGSVALMLSTRLSLMMTMLGSMLVYALGLVSDYLLAVSENIAARTAYYIIPNFQYFRVADVLMQHNPKNELAQHFVLPPGYMYWSILYALALVAVFLCLALALFQKREVS